MGDLENDMDELFRKAANHYPLKTDGADWDKMLGKLPDMVGTPLPLTQPKMQTSNRKLFWLILLFPMGWLCNSYFNSQTNNDKKVSAIVIDTSTTSVKQSRSTDNNINRQVGKNNITTTEGANTPQTSSMLNGTKVVGRKSITSDNTINITHNKGIQISDNLQEDYNQRTSTTGNAEKTLELRSASQKEIEHKDGEGKLPQRFTQTQKITIPQPTTNDIKQLIDTATTKLANFQKDSLSKNTDATKNIVKKGDKKTQKSKGFYVTAIGGLDASSVKSQGIKKAGYSYGMLIGFQFNKHIAVETGFLIDKKQYFTDGKYFDKSRTMIPSNVTILGMNGNCNIFEIPIDFRYNFLPTKKGLFFGTAGLSSYIVKKEGYDYESLVNGMIRPYARTYNNSGNSLFSMIDLSVGYEHKIGKLVSFKINPYLKIPMKGFGIGSLPVTSSGVNIGITVPFHK